MSYVISTIGSYLATYCIFICDYAISQADLTFWADRNHSPLNDTHLRCREKHIIRKKRDEDVWVPRFRAIRQDQDTANRQRANETSNEILSDDTLTHTYTQYFIKWNLAAFKVKFQKRAWKRRRRNGIETARFVCERTNTLYAPAPIVHAHLYCVVEPIGDYGSVYKILL